jgi:hypothetical protein
MCLLPLPLKVALDYSSILLQLRQCRWVNPLELPDSTGSAAEEVSDQVLAALNEQCHHINMLEEDSDRLAVTLEFFLQVINSTGSTNCMILSWIEYRL